MEKKRLETLNSKLDMDDYKKILQDKFEDFEPQPSRDLWPGIAEGLRPRRKLAYWPYAIAAALAILLLIGTFWLRPFGSEGPAQAEPMISQIDSGASVPGEQTPLQPAPQKEVTPAQVAEASEAQTPGRTPQPALPATSPEVVPSQPEAEASKPVLQNVSPTQLAVVKPASPPEANKVEVEAPQLVFISPRLAERRQGVAQATRGGLRSELDLADLKAPEVAAFASQQLDRIGLKSPVQYEQKVEKEKKKSRFRIALGNFSFTRTTYKPIYKK
jgi:hypothetical protein